MMMMVGSNPGQLTSHARLHSLEIYQSSQHHQASIGSPRPPSISFSSRRPKKHVRSLLESVRGEIQQVTSSMITGQL